MTDQPIKPPPGIPEEEVDEPEWPPADWKREDRRAAQERDPERGQHLIWVAIAAVLFLAAWWTTS